MLKIDVEGYESTLLRAARPDLLARVGVVYLEGSEADMPAIEGFVCAESCETVRLRNTALLSA